MPFAVSKKRGKKHFCGVLKSPCSVDLRASETSSDTDTGQCGHMSNFLSKKVVSSSGYFGFLCFKLTSSF